jgi:hypothetical protein
VSSTVTQFSSKIDINFPIAGKEISNSQGFRTNFNRIQSAFSVIGQEVSKLQLTTAKLNDSNDFGYNLINRAKLENNSLKINDLAVVSNGVIDVDITQGNYQKCTVDSGYYTFNVTNWSPKKIYSKLRLEANCSTTSTSTINFAGAVTFIGTETSEISFDGQTPCFWDIWTTNGGKNISVYLLSKAETTGGNKVKGPIPRITSFHPNNGTYLGGTVVIMTGTNFTSTSTTTTVLMNNQECVINSINTTTITFVTAPGSGYTQVVVITPTGNTYDQIKASFRYIPPNSQSSQSGFTGEAFTGDTGDASGSAGADGGSAGADGGSGGSGSDADC